MSAAERPLRIGIACFSTYGGSGVIASEIGLTMAARGHTVHVFSDERPGRLGETNGNVHFHRVEIPSYPQLKGSPYALGLTSKIVEVAWRDGLDLLHAHYAVPHAISAYVARQVLRSAAPAIVTTLHGTDITLVGSDPSFLPLTRFSIVESDAVTAPSAWLAEATYRNLDVPRDRAIEVIPNFVDTRRFAPAPDGPRAAGPRPAMLVHVSNFRSLKRVDDVVAIFGEARRRAPERAMTLQLVGDGPEHERIRGLVRAAGLDEWVQFLGERTDLPSVLRGADLFLLPSETESFGLAALEAMSCGVPVIASRVGGVPEVVIDGETGLLAPVGDVAAMAAHVVRLLADAPLRARLGAAGRRRAETAFPLEATVGRYEALYRRLLERQPTQGLPRP
jgi:N-acetyl-alpha-D-glucosaminyl L-malate synthase BshA